MTNEGILIIVVGIIIVTIIICVTNFFCNYYNDYRDEHIKDSRKLIRKFKKDHIVRDIHGASCDASEEDIISFVEELEDIL